LFIEWVALVVFMLYYVVYQIIWGRAEFKRAIALILQGARTKSWLYSKTMLSSWIAVLLVTGLAVFAAFSFEDIGLTWIHWFNSRWLAYPVAILSGVYGLYLLYQIIILRIYRIQKKAVKTKLTEEMASLLPTTRNEKLIWVLLSITAGIAEEIQFRGYLMYALGNLFPELNVVCILLISAVIFGFAHIYQGIKGVITTGFIGLVYGIVYLAFGSIIPVIILHFLQDVSATDLNTAGNPESLPWYKPTN
jgi:uncharacterized protein